MKEKKRRRRTRAPILFHVDRSSEIIKRKRSKGEKRNEPRGEKERPPRANEVLGLAPPPPRSLTLSSVPQSIKAQAIPDCCCCCFIWPEFALLEWQISSNFCYLWRFLIVGLFWSSALAGEKRGSWPRIVGHDPLSSRFYFWDFLSFYFGFGCRFLGSSSFASKRRSWPPNRGSRPPLFPFLILGVPCISRLCRFFFGFGCRFFGPRPSLQRGGRDPRIVGHDPLSSRGSLHSDSAVFFSYGCRFVGFVFLR